MTWLNDLRGMSEGLDEEFGLPIILSGIVKDPNGRGKPDPKRPSVEVIGIFHEGIRPMGDGRYGRDGLSETKISSTTPYASFMQSCLPWKPTIGDMLCVPEIGRTFRVMDIVREMPGRVQLILEDTKPVPAT